MMLKSKPWRLAFDNEDTFTQVQVDEMLKGTFNQDQVNTMMAEEKRKTTDRHKKLISDLDEAKKGASVTAEDRAALEQRIEDLQNANLTSEEKQKRAADRTKKEYDGKVDVLTEDRNLWQTKHAELMIDTAITKSASMEKAFYTEQISAILVPKTRLFESLDGEGKPSGNFEPKVSFPDTDKEDKPIVLELSVPEAVKRMKELPQYGNLFEGDKRSGIGGQGSSSGGGKIDLAKLAREDMAGYRKLRKEQPELFA